MKNLTQILPSRIIRLACEFEGIKEEELEIRNKRDKVVLVRKYIAYCLMYLKFSNHMIGKLILRDHATITHYKKSFFNNNDSLTRERMYRFKIFMNHRNVIIPGLVDWKKNVKHTIKT